MMYVAIFAFILPTVIGGCCFPKQFSALRYNFDTSYPPSRVTVDYAKGKLLSKSIVPEHPVDYILVDIANSKKYTVFKDGACKASNDVDNRLYNQCMPKDANQTGNAYLGLGMPMTLKLWTYRANSDTNVAVTTSEDCFPVVTSVAVGDSKPLASIWINGTDVIDSSVLDIDISTCVDNDDVVG